MAFYARHSILSQHKILIYNIIKQMWEFHKLYSKFCNTYEYNKRDLWPINKNKNNHGKSY
jgi:hypothetical protein